MNLKQRLTALEQMAAPAVPNFFIESIGDEPTPEQWAVMQTAHDDGRLIAAFKVNATIGIWLPNADSILWSG
ncbi:MAG: hypothetical protein QX198_15570 [Methylococcaceae bacterium]